MIGFNYLFVQPLLDSGISFRSDEYLAQCRVPVLILHADNDWIVPAALGRRVNEMNLEQSVENEIRNLLSQRYRTVLLVVVWIREEA